MEEHDAHADTLQFCRSVGRTKLELERGRSPNLLAVCFLPACLMSGLLYDAVTVETSANKYIRSRPFLALCGAEYELKM